MKDFKKNLRILAVVLAAVCWWSLLYPELFLNPDTVKVTGTSDKLTDSDPLLYRELLKADPAQIKFRSKLLTELNAFWETISWDKSTKN